MAPNALFSLPTFRVLAMLLLLLSPIAAAGHDYHDALRKSILFFEGQRSGRLPPDQRLRWRRDSALHDGAAAGVDLTGGYYDAGDNIKFGFPMAFTTTMLSWSVIDFGKTMGPELGNALKAVRWGTDYLLKATAKVGTSGVVFVQVGDPYSDHNCWERPEDMDTSRAVYKVDGSHPGSDVAGETAAALAAASIVFRSRDPSYSAMLLKRAVTVFDFADRHRGAYSNSLRRAVCPFYCDVNGYQDELLWAAAWLHKASRRRQYREYIIKNEVILRAGDTINEFGWDNKHAGINILISKARVRHQCYPGPLLEVNSELTELQRSKIRQTPFKWLMQIPEHLQINGSLLKELTIRWEERSLAFVIQNKLVPFTPIDVCLALGLHILGENVSLQSDTEVKGHCYTKKLFEGKKITSSTIYDQLQKYKADEHVDDFCRLYVLLGFALFYFPNTKHTVPDALVRILDSEVHSLNKYNWGVLVYDVLVDSLNSVAIGLKEATNSHQINIIGCAAVLQIWALEHLVLSPKISAATLNTFPRVLGWNPLVTRQMNLSKLFKTCCVYEEVAVANEDLHDDILREALEKAPSGFCHWCPTFVKSKKSKREHEFLNAQLRLLDDRISFLEIEAPPLLEWKTTTSTKMGDESFHYENSNTECPDLAECVTIPHVHEPDDDDDAMHEEHHEETHVDEPDDDDDMHEERHEEPRSNMYTRLKDQPRRRVESSISHTPWTTFKKNKKRNHP